MMFGIIYVCETSPEYRDEFHTSIILRIKNDRMQLKIESASKVIGVGEGYQLT
jgi:hypothetical protein